MGEAQDVRAVKVVRAGGCGRCGYALRGVLIVEGRAVCPECGEAFIPALLRLRAVAGPRLGERSSGGLWLLGTIAVGLVVALAWLTW